MLCKAQIAPKRLVIPTASSKATDLFPRFPVFRRLFENTYCDNIKLFYGFLHNYLLFVGLQVERAYLIGGVCPLRGANSHAGRGGQ